MVKLKTGGLYLRDFGSGVTDDVEKAHDFTPDEAAALLALRADYTAADDRPEPTLLEAAEPPHIDPGAISNMVWVRYNGCWFAAERQALFMGTRLALQKHLTSTGEVA